MFVVEDICYHTTATLRFLSYIIFFICHAPPLHHRRLFSDAARLPPIRFAVFHNTCRTLAATPVADLSSSLMSVMFVVTMFIL